MLFRSVFIFSVLVNDSDGKGRKGWIEWGSGMGHSMNTSLFRACAITEGMEK